MRMQALFFSLIVVSSMCVRSLSTPNPKLPETLMLTPNAGQLMGMLVNLQGLVFTIITASDPVAVPLLRSGNFLLHVVSCSLFHTLPLPRASAHIPSTTALSHVHTLSHAPVCCLLVSGARARFDIVNFPPTSDDWLVNGLRYTVVDERNKDNVELLGLPFVAASGEVEQLMTTMKLPANQQLVLESYEDCVFVVKHLGSHFEDLQVALKRIVEGASTEGQRLFVTHNNDSLFFASSP